MSISSISSSSSSSAFNFDGVVSGLNTTDIISKLMQLEQAPVNQLKKQQTSIQNRDAAYQAIESKVFAFQSALHTLLIPSNVNAKAAASSDATIATATASSAAANGTYALNVQRLATATTVSSSVWNAATSTWTKAPIGAGLKDGTEAGSPTMLANAGFSTTPTAGTFTIDGVHITITDPTTQSLNDVITQINTNPGLSGKITASVTTDANGNKNYIQLHSVDGNPIQLGSGSDTSNFLAAAHLVSSGLSTTTDGQGNVLTSADLVSSVPLGAVNTSALLSSTQFGTPLTASTGSFYVNGKQITWDASKDTLSSVLSKINTSGAGVTAVYDPTSDSVALTNVATGSQSIDFSNPNGGANDDGGLLAALRLNTDPAQQKLGQTAQFSINNGPTQYSNSNTISGVVPGMSMTLAKVGSTNLTVSQDTKTTTDNVQAFVSAFNDLVDLIDKDTAYDATNKTASVLTGDSGVQDLEAQIRRFLTSPATGVQGQYTSLASIGISTGAFGSAVGTTNHLSLDTTKLTTALQNDPNAVVSVLIGQPTATLNPGPARTAGDGHGMTISGVPSSSTHGQYRVTVNPDGTASSVFTPFGSNSLAAVTGSLTWGSNNTTLIPGLSINMAAAPASSITNTIVYSQSGILGQLSDYLTGALGTGGVFDTEHSSANSELKSLNDQITSANETLAQRQTTLQQQFTAMEVALSQLNMQGAQMLSSLGITYTPPSGSKSSSSS